MESGVGQWSLGIGNPILQKDDARVILHLSSRLRVIFNWIQHQNLRMQCVVMTIKHSAEDNGFNREANPAIEGSLKAILPGLANNQGLNSNVGETRVSVACNLSCGVRNHTAT